MRFKKIISYSIFVILIGCKKDSPLTSSSGDPISTSYYLKASINGVESEFNTELHASFLDPTSTIRCSFVGTQQLIQDTAVLGLTFLSQSHANLSSFTTYPTSQISLLLGYNKRSSSHIYYNDQYGSNFTVVVDSITNLYISGSFSGLIMDERIPADTIIVSNGKFKVPKTQ